MDLSTLPKDELQKEFLRINAAYINASAGRVADYMNTPAFLKIREELRIILNELQKRREIMQINKEFQ